MKSFATRAPISWLLLAAVMLLAACDRVHEPPLRVASSPWPGYEPLYLAQEIGYLTERDAQMFELPSSDITLESFRNHSADIATLTLDETLDLLHSGVRLRILMVMDVSNGADAVMASPGVKSLAGLKGKRIAILNIPLGVYMLSRTLDAAKLTRKDVKVIPSAESKHEEMYRQGRADAFITFEPFKTRLAAQGAQVLFDSSDIPNEVFDLMVVHEDVFVARRAGVCNVARQWLRTLDYMEQSPQPAAASIAKRLGVTPQEYRTMVQGIKTPSGAENLELIGSGRGILQPARRLGAVMLEEGQLKHSVDPASALIPDLQACLGY